MVADLHIHSNFSDGTHSPEEVVAMAKEARLKTISITDHDVVEGILPAQEEGQRIGIEVISGVEFTTELPKAEVHILGYFIDYKNQKLLEVLAKIQKSRSQRVYQIVEKLMGMGINLEAEEVFSLAKGKSPGRPHVARALLAKKIVRSVKEAFERFLDFHAPAYVPHYKLTPAEAIALIKEAGGIAVFAHPGMSNCDEIIPDLMAEGLRGLEVYYPAH
ncbi:MAG: PHP domain-containing protein, partial [Candidatus Margulisiibacteriota bacterium]